jgi:hypothetical protein
MDSTRLSRRGLLVGLGAVGLSALSAGALAGCARREEIAVSPGQSELLVGKGQRVAFGVSTLTQEPIPDTEVEVRFVTDRGVAGPVVRAKAHTGVAALPIYLASIDVPAAGFGYIQATTPDGRKGGEGAINAVDPANSATVVPGRKAISVPTPTTADPLGVARICTRKVGGQYAPCGMHTASLDQMLAAHRPVMLAFATPEFCMSATCGPAVATIDAARASRAWGDLAWIHVEIYRDADAKMLMEAVAAWRLPSEPWLFAIDRTGTVVARLEGPILSEEVPPLAERLSR